MFNNEVLSSLNELEYSIYNCITKNQDHIAHMTIKELAAEAHVSTGSILRFCKKVGCTGYSHFKLCYRDYLEQQRQDLVDSGEATIKNFFFYIDSPAFRQSIDDACRMLQKARQVIFIGIGSSGALGKYGARYFSNMGKFSLNVEDPWQPVLQTLGTDTVAVVLSESGTTPQTVNIASQLKERGSLLLCITNHAGSTLAKIADCSITYHVPEVINSRGNITTQVPVLYILETLAKKLYMDEASS